MQQRLAPILFKDDDKEAAEAARTSPVAPACRSPRALRKIHTKATEDGVPVHSFATVLKDLATVVANHVRPNDTELPGFIVITTPTPLQRRAFDLLGVSSHRPATRPPYAAASPHRRIAVALARNVPTGGARWSRS